MNPNAAFQNNVTGGAQGTPVTIPPAVNGTPPEAAPQPSSPIVTINPPQNSVGPGNMPPTPAVGSVAGSIPTPQAQTTPQTPTVAQIMSSLGPTAAQYGSQSTTPGAQYSQIAQSYSALAATNQGTQVPASNPMQTPEVQSQLQGSTQQSSPQQEYFDAYSGMNPITQSLYNNITQMMSTQQTQQSLAQEFQTLAGPNSTLSTDQLQLMNIQTVMNGTQDDVANEITAAGGTATQSQVMAITAARNNVIMKQASFLQNQLSVQQSYVNGIMQFTQADQSQVSNEINQQTGLLGQMDTIQTTMNSNATSAYQSTLKNLGDNYTSFASTIPTSMQPYAEGLLGLAPGTLSNPQELTALTNAAQTQMADYFKFYGIAPPTPTTPSGTSTPTVTSTPTGSGEPTVVSDSSTQVTLSNGQVLNTVIGGINFGNFNGPGSAYASNIYNEVTGVGKAYNGIVSAYGSANPTSNQLQQYINNNAPNSPVTAQMITSAAQQSGISSAILAALLQNESNFGTIGQATTTENAGNVGNTGTSTQSMSSWAAGVTAAAQNLAIRSNVTSSNTPTGPTTSTVQTEDAAMPQQFQDFVKNLPTFDGVPYYTTPTTFGGMDTAEKSSYTNWLSQLGIQPLSAVQTNALESINSAQTDMNQFGTYIATGAGGGTPLLPWSASGQPQQAADVKWNEYLASNNQLANFNTWAASTLNVLAGLKGAGSGSGGSSRLFNTITGLMPEDTDTLPEAMGRISIINNILTNNAKSILGNNAPIVAPNPAAYFVNGNMYASSDGVNYSLIQ